MDYAKEMMLDDIYELAVQAEEFMGNVLDSTNISEKEQQSNSLQADIFIKEISARVIPDSIEGNYFQPHICLLNFIKSGDYQDKAKFKECISQYLDRLPLKNLGS